MTESKTHVAVVDDDKSFSRAVERLLRAAGFEPFVCPSAEAFLQDTTHPSPACLVLDLHLSGMSGLDLCRRLNALGKTAPVILVTAHDEPETREEARRAGCSAYFCKPVPGRLLLDAVTNAINRN